jgi:hypothetical protein
MKKVIRLTESDLTRLVKKVMMEVSSVNQPKSGEIEKAASIFNQKVGENISSDDFKNILGCTNPNDPVDVNLSSIPKEEQGEAKQKIDELQEKMKSASFSELMKLKRQFKDFRKQERRANRQQNEQVISTAVFMGVAMPPAVAAVATFALGGLLIFLIIKMLFPKLYSACFRSSRNFKWYY